MSDLLSHIARRKELVDAPPRGGGGTDEKPVGLVYMAVCDADGVYGERCEFAGTREEIKEQTAGKALGLLLERAR